MTEAQRIHLKLMATLPVRTHYATPYKAPTVTGKKRVVTGVGRGGANRREINIGGKIYPSIRVACAACKVSNKTIYYWLNCGLARYT